MAPSAVRLKSGRSSHLQKMLFLFRHYLRLEDQRRVSDHSCLLRPVHHAHLKDPQHPCLAPLGVDRTSRGPPASPGSYDRRFRMPCFKKSLDFVHP
mmetsp:Transcript_30906/g.72458  ORF Transcript_30906/g.72458 Transcript_30906/m.72458 type:complete len:96 (+) Transcript_30906:394-681(+)